METRMRFTSVVAILLLLLHPKLVLAQLALTGAQKTSLASAIEDEIYDYRLELNFTDVGKRLYNGTVEVPLFLTQDSTESAYHLIYRLMPYGEMYRLATVTPNGMVRLFRNPKIGFPPDAPATLTVYYDDDAICVAKQKALRLSFVIELNPTKQRLREAIKNQQERYGFSNLLRETAKKRQSH
jgi:hypothetical protein